MTPAGLAALREQHKPLMGLCHTCRRRWSECAVNLLLAELDAAVQRSLRLADVLESYTRARVVTSWGYEEEADDGGRARLALRLFRREEPRYRPAVKKEQ